MSSPTEKTVTSVQRERSFPELVKFAGSSFAGFLTDYGMFFLLSQVTQGLGDFGVPVSNVGARLVSATVNYFINKKIVFKSPGRIASTAARYFLLAAVILIGNTALVTVLNEILGMNRYAAKIITEAVFFTFSYLMQKFVIFRRKNHSGGSPDFHRSFEK